MSVLQINDCQVFTADSIHDDDDDDDVKKYEKYLVLIQTFM